MQRGVGIHACPGGTPAVCGEGPQICALSRLRHTSRGSPRTMPSRSPELCLGRIIFVTEIDPESGPRGDPTHAHRGLQLHAWKRPQRVPRGDMLAINGDPNQCSEHILTCAQWVQRSVPRWDPHLCLEGTPNSCLEGTPTCAPVPKGDPNSMPGRNPNPHTEGTSASTWRCLIHAQEGP